MVEFLQILVTSSKSHQKPSKNDPWCRRAYAKTSPWLTPYYSYRAFAMQEICSTSHLRILPRGPPQATHAPAWKIWEFEVPNPFKMIGFHQKIEIFPEAPGSLKLMFYDVLWCPGGPSIILEWFWIDSGSIIFSSLFVKIWPRNVKLVSSISRAGSIRFSWNLCRFKRFYIKKPQLKRIIFLNVGVSPNYHHKFKISRKTFKKWPLAQESIC